jgi:hypothetical protein
MLWVIIQIGPPELAKLDIDLEFSQPSSYAPPGKASCAETSGQ